MAEEASDAPADTGSEVELLKVDFPNVDFGEDEATLSFSDIRTDPSR